MAISGTRDLLLWCRQQTQQYSNVNVYNLTTSWRDGLAFCAIIDRYRPDLIEFDRLSKENIAENNELAFTIAERYLDIPSLLDVTHMVDNIVPDKLGIITYVSQLYHCFKDKTPANQGYSTKMKPLPRARSDSAGGNKIGKRTSPSALSGTAKRMATALRNVFRSDAKEEHTAKHREQNSAVKQNRKVDDGTSNFIKTVPAAGSTCTACNAKVYLMERLIVEKKLFHRSCFKCRKCGTSLRPGTYQYFSDADIFCCLFDCTTVPEEKPEKPLVIKLWPICDVAAELEQDENDGLSTETPTSPKSTARNESKSASSPKQFAVVKRNTIKLNSLPQSVEKFRSRGPARRGSHTSKNNSVKAGERKRSLSVGSKYKSKKSHDSRRKLSVGSNLGKSASPRGSYYGREERSAKKELGIGKDTPGRYKNDLDSSVLGTALKMALMEGANKCLLPKGSDANTVESEAKVKGQRSDVKGSLTVIVQKPAEDSTVRPSVESVSEKECKKVVVKELRMETLNEEITPRTSRCYSREFSSDDLSRHAVDGASFKDELLQRAVPKGSNEKQDSECTVVIVESMVDNRKRSQEEDMGKDLKQKEKEKGSEKDVRKDSRANSMESEKKYANEDGIDVEEDEKQTEQDPLVQDSTASSLRDEKEENGQSSQGEENCNEQEKPRLRSTTSSSGVKDKNVQNLKNKFLKIDDMIDARHKTNLARYNLQKRKELQSVTSWTQQTSSTHHPRKKLVNTSEASKRELGGCRRSIKQLTAMYMNEIEKDKKKGRNRVGSPRDRTASDTSSTLTERSDSGPGSESWSRRTSVSSRRSSGAQEEETITEESSKQQNVPELVAEVSEEVSKTASKGGSAEGQSYVQGDEKSEEIAQEAVRKDQTDSKRAEVGAEVSTESYIFRETNTAEENQSSCGPDGAGFSDGKIRPMEEVVEEKTEIKANKTSHPPECILRKEFNSTGESPSPPDSDLASSSLSPVPEVKIQSPRPDPTSTNPPEPRAEPIETVPALGKELTLEIAFPNGAAPTLHRNAASHDSGIDMPSCSSAHSPTYIEAGLAGEEVNVVLPLPANRTSCALDREVPLSGMPVSAASDEGPLSPGPDVLSGVGWSNTQRPQSSTSAEDSSSSSTPRMSIIIAQERSSTKINSRYFSLETSDPKLVSEYHITEESFPDEVMDVEGEFRFGQERIHVTRADKGAIVSIYRDTKFQNGRKNYNKEDEISLPPGKIEAEIQALANLNRNLEKRGVEIEKALRESSADSDNVAESDEDLLIEWLNLVQNRNMVLRREAELTYLVQSQTYEQRYRTVENELRQLVAMKDDVKSSDDTKRERELLSELLELVHKRTFIVVHLEEDRIRERNEKLQAEMSDGITDTWDQSPEYTKVRHQKARARGLKHKSRVKRHKSLGTSRESLVRGQKSQVMRQRPQLMCYKSKVEG